ncbi:glycosyltransferase family 2 protein [Actinoplanes sp. Pm04-4]|uniref:Glycosyltransferase family 2 protein n=1 Tax=Paractinoplanes pyxinae TaxID=2997416 RepID=A0ABT4BH30_9ACTN|nr:glycosyltransferase family 2 protein [Actinoplanes pyxinae]MCY1145287.1 glycosyltransferase family 2 protein [Actinoplanes pyxinae]
MIPVRDPAGLRVMLHGMPPVNEIVVVDLAGDLPEQPGALLVRPARPGAGYGLACGIRAARGDVVVTLNGDGSTDPAEIPRFVGALVDGADVALGSRYAAGGRDLTGGRFRRWANLLLMWVLNALLGTRRTDPGFGYAAFWRDAVPELGLPTSDAPPSHGAAHGAGSSRGAAWGSGVEIGAVLALRPAVRGLRVAEVPSVAYPPIRRAARADQLRLRHWLRAALRERRSASTVRPAAPRPRAAVNEVAYYQGKRVNETGAGRRALDRRAVEALAAGQQSSERLAGADGWEQADRRAVRPLWASAGRRPAAAHHLSNGAPPVWRDGHPERLGGPDTQPRPGSAPWQVGGTTQPAFRPEVGSRRRRIAGVRQSQPDLRVINGEGAGTATGRRARLRSVKKPQI